MMDYSDSHVGCPYNLSHVLLKSRYQTHIVKCRKASANPNQNLEPILLKTCPLNANHHIRPNDWDHHLMNCPDLGSLTRHKFVATEKSIPYVPINVPESDENWDEEPSVPTYDPSGHASEALVIRSLHGGSRSERIAFRYQERDRIGELREKEAKNGDDPPKEVKPKPMVEVTHAYSDQALRHPKSVYLKNSLLGQGRGMPVNNSQAASTVGSGRMPGCGRGTPLGSVASEHADTPSLQSTVTEPRGGDKNGFCPARYMAKVSNGQVLSSEEECLGAMGALKLDTDSEGFTEIKSKKYKKKAEPFTQSEKVQAATLDGQKAANNPLKSFGANASGDFPHPSRGRGRILKK